MDPSLPLFKVGSIFYHKFSTSRWGFTKPPSLLSPPERSEPFFSHFSPNPTVGLCCNNTKSVHLSWNNTKEKIKKCSFSPEITLRRKSKNVHFPWNNTTENDTKIKELQFLSHSLLYFPLTPPPYFLHQFIQNICHFSYSTSCFFSFFQQKAIFNICMEFFFRSNLKSFMQLILHQIQ